jgi:hypothetical protein
MGLGLKKRASSVIKDSKRSKEPFSGVHTLGNSIQENYNIKFLSFKLTVFVENIQVSLGFPN